LPDRCLANQIRDRPAGRSGSRLANGKKRLNLGHFWSVGTVFEQEARLYGVRTKKPSSHAKNRQGWKKSCRTLYKTEKVGIIKVDGFGLFSVPAPPFHFPVSGGVFIFLAGLLIQSWIAWVALGFHPAPARSVRSATVLLKQVMQSTFWHLDGNKASLILPRLSLAFDANRPGEGLNNIRVLNHDWPDGRLFGVTGPIQSAANCELTECYVRGDDLIAVYETGSPDKARIDLRWSVAKSAEVNSPIARIDLLVSIRTDRLDWRHDVSLESVIPAAGESSELSTNADSFAAIDGNWSLDVMVHPADLRRREIIAVSGSSDARLLRHELFPAEILEKGVILRARAAAMFLNANVEVSAVAAQGRAYVTEKMREFQTADPPLGT
jgi:hypothetical protein